MSPTAANISTRSFLRRIARRLGFGSVVYRIWHAPRSSLTLLSKKGLLNAWRVSRGKAQMNRFAERLQPLPSAPDAPALEVHILTGRKFIHQTILCLYSLQKTSGHRLGVHLYDDGSLSGSASQLVQTILPGARIYRPKEIEQRLDTVLPKEEFPTLRSQRLTYPQIRKLTDIHAGRSGWQLALDADMLFFSNPEELVAWSFDPEAPLFMRDCEQSYGYSPSILESLAGRQLPERLNVGVAGIRAGSLAWAELEAWARHLIRMEGSSYYLEQALCALIATKDGYQILPDSKYIVRPSNDDAAAGRGCLQHYVSESRTAYYLSAWRRWERLLHEA